MYQFERKMFEKDLMTCQYCKRCCLSMEMKTKTKCDHCHQNHDKFTVNNEALPIWYDDIGEMQFDVPKELSSLTIAEKLLIARISPYVPIVHI